MCKQMYYNYLLGLKYGKASTTHFYQTYRRWEYTCIASVIPFFKTHVHKVL
jgi:hypothetical protein